MNRYDEKKSQDSRNTGSSDSSKARSASSPTQSGGGPANRKSTQPGSVQREDQPSDQGKKQFDAGEGAGGQVNQSVPREGLAAGRKGIEEPSERQPASGAAVQSEGNDDSDAVEADKAQRLDAAFEDGERRV